MSPHPPRWPIALAAATVLVLLACVAAPIIRAGSLPLFALPLTLDGHHTLVLRNAVDCRRDIAHPSCTTGNASYEFSLLYRHDQHVRVLFTYRQ